MNNKKDYDYGKYRARGELMKMKRINQDCRGSSPRLSRGVSNLIVVESVPVCVCHQCGEKIVMADNGRKLATLAHSPALAQRKTMTVPVVRSAKEVTSSVHKYQGSRSISPPMV